MAVKLIDELQKEIKAAGEAVKQEAYEKAYDHVFQILDNLEKLLNDNRYLEGNEITEEDKRLYDILIRFDAVYYFKQRLNRKAYKTTFCRSKEAYWDAYNSFYAAMDLLEERLENRRFLFGDYVTDSDVRLYVTLARLDIRYTHQLGHTKHPLFTYKNLWAYARDLYQIPAFKNNTYFKDFANPDNKKQGRTFESFNARFLDEIDFDAYWGAPHNRARLSSDPGNKFRTEKQD